MINVIYLGAFRWAFPKRQGYLDKVIEEGWEDNAIPKLDDEPEE